MNKLVSKVRAIANEKQVPLRGHWSWVCGYLAGMVQARDITIRELEEELSWYRAKIKQLANRK